MIAVLSFHAANVIKTIKKRAERPCFLSFFQHWSTIFPGNRYPEVTTVAQMLRIPHICHEYIVGAMEQQLISVTISIQE